jgi:hypothetical protein
MKWINRLPLPWRGTPRSGKSARGRAGAVRGTIQRVNYPSREVRVVAEGRVWEFVLAADCQLWFADIPATLRCFHPLDPVIVLYQDQEAEHRATAMYSWEPAQTTDGGRAPGPGREAGQPATGPGERGSR